MMRQVNVAVVGATGAVGEVMVEILARAQLPGCRSCICSRASARRATVVRFDGRSIRVKRLDQFDFAGVDIGLFSAGAAISAEFAPKAAAAGCVVIDNTSQFRYDDDMPLVVPEVNPHAIAQRHARGIIANPNCSTIQMVVALKPIFDAVGIERINVATYQSVSGAGAKGVRELAGADGGSAEREADRAEGVFAADRVQRDPAHRRVPGQRLHEGRNEDGVGDAQDSRGARHARESDVRSRAGLLRPFGSGSYRDANQDQRGRCARAAIARRRAFRCSTNARTAAIQQRWSMAAGQGSGFVGRIREDISHPRGLDLWIVSDNVRKGAALNSVQIAELLLKEQQ